MSSVSVAKHSKETANNLAAIRAAARTSDYFYEQVRFLANHIGPRLSGSRQAAAAVEYVHNQMRDLGLSVQLEPVIVRHWVRGREEAQLVRYPGRVDETSQKIVVTALGNTVGTPADGVTAPIVVVGTFEELDALPSERVTGKVVLFDHAFDDMAAQAGRWEHAYGRVVPYRSDGPAKAALKGAVAALVRSSGPTGLRLPHTGLTRFADGIPPIPAGAVTTEDAQLITDLAKHGEVVIRLLLTPYDLPQAGSYNVIADLKGSQFPEEIVIVSGHLDSWDLGTGALDDAAGVGVAMDVLRIINSTDARPRRTVRFVAWMNEENGTAGGRAYAKAHERELRDHVAAVEIDFGDGRPLGLSVHAEEGRFAKLSAVLQAIADPIGGVVRVPTSPGVDLTAMSQAGVPAIAPLQDARRYFEYHHTPADTFDKVRPDELRQEVEVLGSLIYLLAQH